MSATSLASRSGTDSTASDRVEVLAFIADEQSEAALRGGLGPLISELVVRRGGVAAAIRAMEREPTPKVLIVDVAGLEDPTPELEALAAVCEPDVRVLVVGDRDELPLYRRLTHDLGVHEYIYKPLTRDHVARLFGPAIAGAVVEREATGRGGRVVSVLNARGGAGATTVAANLALELSAASRSHVALVDLHLRGGTIGLSLGVKPSSGLRIALEHPDRVDALFLERAAIPVGDRVRVIAAEEPIDAAPTASAESVKRLLELLRHRFNTIVVDLRSPPGAVEKAVLAASRQVLITFGPDVAGVRDALALKRMVLAQGTGSHPLLVLNRLGIPGGLSLPLVEEGLGGRPECVLPWQPKQILRALNLGQPATAACPALKRALVPLVREVSGTAAVRRRGGLFGWLRRA
ncbi:pilus assembly protein CpaE [Falsiroseomonas bella]|uniref:Pilus assembly protein CpaE n=1 Tax=Falsiroseomonas bella TaxID=2184016 RepID=A0A317F4W5_9PROT|nr:pilus assembly protein CpaE [Falsiroseomonas bella]PWS34201.1 pilus assembly protein CpaE [Falsiroseomonas bella]